MFPQYDRHVLLLELAQCEGMIRYDSVDDRMIRLWRVVNNLDIFVMRSCLVWLLDSV
jgi:hypothetical protein